MKMFDNYNQVSPLDFKKLFNISPQQRDKSAFLYKFEVLFFTYFPSWLSPADKNA